MKRFFTAFTLATCMLICSSAAPHAGTKPKNHCMFSQAGVNLSTAKVASFTAVTTQCCSEIKLNGVLAQGFNPQGNRILKTWKLTTPTARGLNDTLYAAAISYADEIGSGHIRLFCVFSADGVICIRYSPIVNLIQ